VIAARDVAAAEPKVLRYSGKQADDSTSLYYYGGRYFAPWLGRWLSADPAGPTDGLNLYAFVRDNPVTLLDSDGRVTGDPNVPPPTPSAVFDLVALGSTYMLFKGPQRAVQFLIANYNRFLAPDQVREQSRANRNADKEERNLQIQGALRDLYRQLATVNPERAKQLAADLERFVPGVIQRRLMPQTAPLSTLSIFGRTPALDQAVADHLSDWRTWALNAGLFLGSATSVGQPLSLVRRALLKNAPGWLKVTAALVSPLASWYVVTTGAAEDRNRVMARREAQLREAMLPWPTRPLALWLGVPDWVLDKIAGWLAWPVEAVRWAWGRFVTGQDRTLTYSKHVSHEMEQYKDYTRIGMAAIETALGVRIIGWSWRQQGSWGTVRDQSTALVVWKPSTAVTVWKPSTAVTIWKPGLTGTVQIRNTVPTLPGPVTTVTPWRPRAYPQPSAPNVFDRVSPTAVWRKLSPQLKWLSLASFVVAVFYRQQVNRSTTDKKP
jgi:RHS repeat-associated protein